MNRRKPTPQCAHCRRVSVVTVGITPCCVRCAPMVRQAALERRDEFIAELQAQLDRYFAEKAAREAA